MKKIGILGGTFDPIHYGHLAIGEAALNELGLEKIILVPSYVQPFKVGQEITSPQHRVNMARIAAAEYDFYEVYDKEAFRSKISYTYETLSIMKEQLKDFKVYFIMGTDSFLRIKEWYKWETLLKEFPIIVAGRRDKKEEEAKVLKDKLIKENQAEVYFINNKLYDISSTDIRKRVQKGETIEGLVLPAVERYITENGIYQ